MRLALRINTRPIILAAFVAILSCGLSRADDASPGLALFEREIRPLLIAHCHACHGPKKQEAGLRLDAREYLLRGGENGPVVVPGNPDESLLLKVVSHDGDIKMPPDDKLRADQIASLVAWVKLDAPWPAEVAGAAAAKTRGGPITDDERRHWSFQPIADPVVPSAEAGSFGHELIDLPSHVGEAASFAGSPIDLFIAARRQAAGIDHAAGPLALDSTTSKRLLLRRATFDLTGLPPTPAEAQAFLADDSPEAFARVVDRLLASPRYGQRWGRHWLDVVRYADTAGETADYPVPESRRYRDYVIDAFNRDKPFDEFLREQVAGDLLAQSEQASGQRYADLVVATGYLAISRRFGFDSENYHHLTIQDTIDTLGQSMLGLTLGCARCHDHKYDPVSMADYYGLYGIFAGTRYAFPGSEQKQKTRGLAALVPPAEAEERRVEFERQLAATERDLESLQIPYPRVKLPWLNDLDGDFDLQQPAAGGSRGVLVPPWLYEGDVQVVGSAQSPFRNVFPRGGASGVNLPGGEGAAALSQSLRAVLTQPLPEQLHFNLDFRTAQPGDGRWRLALSHGPDGSAAVELFICGAACFVRDGDEIVQVAAIVPGTWHNLQLTLRPAERTFVGRIATPEVATEISPRRFASRWDGVFDYLQLTADDSQPGPRPALDVDNIAVRRTSLDPLTMTPASAGTPPADAAKEPAPPSPEEIERRKAAAAQRFNGLLASGPYPVAYAVAEGTPQNAPIHKRGEPARLGDEVPRRFLEILGADALANPEANSGRLDLARWVTRPDNPLTARVIVNRVWQQHFGQGIVPTENDFGLRGQRPTHPELLDWLARRFIDDGWSIKALHRRIMLSATYQLSGEFVPSAAEIDPENQFLWRFRRRRLDAESIRDGLLFVGGQLDESPGGAHPFPPPEAFGFTQHNPFTAVYDTNRRSVYLMTQRLKRHPFLGLFDGADPNSSTARRGTTTVPTQALFMMNDPFVHAQAAGLARNLLARQPDTNSRITLAYESTLGRMPTEQETAEAGAFIEEYQSQLTATGIPEADREPSAWAALVRTLFSENEFLFVD